MTTPLLGLLELLVGQADKEADHNETIRDLEVFANLRFIDRDLATPPGSPAESDTYLVPGSPTGAWAGQAGKIAWSRGGTWKFASAYEGMKAWVNDENALIVYHDGAWDGIAGGGAPITTSLYQLSDVNVSGSGIIVDGYVLTWDEATQLWVAAAAVGGGGDLLAANNLSDVDDAAAAGANIRPVECIIIAVGDETTALTTGTAKVTFHLPYNMTWTEVFTGLTAQSSSGAVTTNVKKAGSTIFSTKPSIDASEDTSLTGTAAVLSVTTGSKGDKMTIDIDAAGTDAAGLKVYLIGHRT